MPVVISIIGFFGAASVHFASLDGQGDQDLCLRYGQRNQDKCFVYADLGAFVAAFEDESRQRTGVPAILW